MRYSIFNDSLEKEVTPMKSWRIIEQSMVASWFLIGVGGCCLQSGSKLDLEPQVMAEQRNVIHFRYGDRIMKYRFITQKGRYNANDACEAASLKMALSHFGIAKNESLDRFVRSIPRSRNPERGYTKNPYVLGTGALLYPRALRNVARRYGAKRSYIIDDYYRHGKGLYGHRAPAESLIKAISRGYPVVFEGSNRMQYGRRTRRSGYGGFRSDHVLMLYGYKHGRLYWTDPNHWHDLSGSTPVKTFMQIVNSAKRGPRAVAIGK